MCHTPPLCDVSHIGEVARSDGGIKFFKNLFGGFFNHSPRRQKCTYQQEIHR